MNKLLYSPMWKFGSRLLFTSGDLVGHMLVEPVAKCCAASMLCLCFLRTRKADTQVLQEPLFKADAVRMFIDNQVSGCSLIVLPLVFKLPAFRSELALSQTCFHNRSWPALVACNAYAHGQNISM